MKKTIGCVVFVVLALLLAACSKGGGKQPASASAVPTTVAQGPVAPLTGLPEGDDSKRNRTLLTVKIDNAPDGRPQFGIDHADDIVEEKVEGGLSRFMALFQSDDSDKVGPVRSLRSTDANWLKAEGGMISYSGGIDPVKGLLPKNGVADVGADTHGTKYYKRRSDRPFEHSMYTNTSLLRGDLTPKGAPAAKPLYEYLNPGQQFGGAGEAPVTSVSGAMANLPTAVRFDWTWDQSSGQFKRGTDGKPHVIENAGQIGMQNVIIQFTDYRKTPWRDTAGTPVDEAVVTGGGDAWMLSNGKIVRGHWSRASDDSITTFSDANGAPIKLQPGHTWLSLVPTGQSLDVK